MIFALIGLLVLFGPWIFAFSNYSKISKQEEDIKRLRESVTRLSRAQTLQAEAPPAPAPQASAEKAPAQTTAPPEGISKEAPFPPPEDIPAATALPPASTPWEDEVSAGTTVLWEDEPQTTRRAKPAVHMAVARRNAQRSEKEKDDFEFRFGKSLPVWVGGIALALSGFFLVKYSIEKGLLTENVRVALGFIFGIALFGAGSFIRNKKPNMADGIRIAQTLTGAGIAVLYGTFFAATKFYGMPRPVGFGGMIGVTLLAVLSSLRNGMPIAALGMLGGFATPALLSNGTYDSFGLFGYLFLLCAGLFAMIRSRNWWVLAVPALLLSFFWTLGWILTEQVTQSGPWPGLFLLAIAATALLSAQKPPADAAANVKEEGSNERDWNLISGYLAACGATVLMAMLTARTGFGLLEWGMYAALGAGCLLMSWLKPAQYRYAPWGSMLVTAVMVLSWQTADAAQLFLIVTGFGLMYGLTALFFLRRNPSLEHGLTLAAAALGFYGLGYLRLHGKIYDALHLTRPDVTATGFVATPHFWGALACLLSLGFALMTGLTLHRQRDNDRLRDLLSALFSLVTTAFISLALLIEVHQDFLPVAFALELLAVCWVALRINIPYLRKIAGLLFYVFWLSMAPQLLDLLEALFNSLIFGTLFTVPAGIAPPIVSNPALYLGVPFLSMASGSWLLTRRHDSKLTEWLEMGAVTLGMLMFYFFIRHAFHAPENILSQKAGFLERGIVTNFFFVAGLGIVYTGRMFVRRALLWSGSFLFALALFRVGYFDYFIYNPLWAAQAVGAAPIFNSLPLTYGLPLLWLWLEEKPALRMAVMPALKGAAVLLLVFTLVSLEVRQAFHGTVIAFGHDIMSNAEIYSYSAAWLGLSALLLLLGTLRQHKPLRVVALILMMVTVCKAFLYDARELEGLYRVFAFMGLGLSLIGLSWFYSRFILHDNGQDGAKGEE